MKRNIVWLMVALGLSLSLGTSQVHSYDGIHGSHKAIPKVNYDSLFVRAKPLNQAIEGQSILEASIAAYGGAEHLESLESFLLTYHMVPIMSQDSIEVVKAYSRDHGYRTTRETSKGLVTRGIFDDQAWYQDSETAMALPSGRHHAELFSYLTLSLPLALQTESFSEIRFGYREGDDLGYFYCHKPDTLMLVVGIHPEDHLVHKSEGIVYQEDKRFVFVNHFSDFRKYDGYWMPRHVINVSMGLEVGQSVLHQAKINAPMGALGLQKPHLEGLAKER